MTEATKWLGQSDLKGTTKAFFIFDSWFALKRLSDDSMYADIDIILEWLKPIQKGSIKIP